MPPCRAVRPEAASSVAPVVIHYSDSLRPCLGTAIAPRRRALSRQTLLAAWDAHAGLDRLHREEDRALRRAGSEAERDLRCFELAGWIDAEAACLGRLALRGRE